MTLPYVVAIGFSLLLFTLLVNVVVVQYGRGVVRSALDEGTRAGARMPDSAAAAVAACEATAHQARAGLLGGAIGDGIELACSHDGAQVIATASGAMPSWLPGLPEWPVAARASARHETVP